MKNQSSLHVHHRIPVFAVMDHLSLVIIEDEDAHFSLMERTITEGLPNVIIHHFRDGQVCLERLAEIAPDIIITDYLMPGMNGIEFLEALGQGDMEIPVIMITGQGDENIAVRAMKLGAWDYLVKSADFFTLLPSVVEKVIREWNLKESLRRSERRFQDLAERTSNWLWEVDTQGKVVYSNPIVGDILGYDPKEMLGKHFYDLFDENDKVLFKKRIFRLMDQRARIYGLEVSLMHKDGHKVFVEIQGVPVYDRRGDLLGYRGVNRDITSRKQAESALRESEDKFRSIFAESPIGIELYDAEGRLTDANKFCLEIFGIPHLSEIIGLKLFENPNIPDDAKARLHRGETVKYETAYDFEEVKRLNLYQTSKSGIIHLDVLITQLGLDSRDSFSGFLFQCRDISKRKRAEEHVRSLSQQLIKAQEIERQRISCDLHDNLAQDLSSLKINLDTLFDDNPEMSAEKRQEVAKLSRAVQKAVKSVRGMAYDLRPASLEQLGLVRTLSQHCEEFSERNGLQVDFFSAGMDDLKLDFDTRITLYRVVQEGLNNVLKHASATHVKIRLVASFPKIILRIQDDGTGFDVNERLETAFMERRMGLRSMQERVALVNGKLIIESLSNKGTRISAELPYQEDNIE